MTNRIGLLFWINLSFAVDHSWTFRSIIDIAIDLFTSEDRYILWIALVPLFIIPTTIGNAHACIAVTPMSRRLLNLRPWLDHCYSTVRLYFSISDRQQSAMFSLLCSGDCTMTSTVRVLQKLLINGRQRCMFMVHYHIISPTRHGRRHILRCDTNELNVEIDVIDTLHFDNDVDLLNP